MTTPSSAPQKMIAVSPHPDDEVLGAGGALYAARAADQRAEVLAVSLVRPDDHARRHRELEQAVVALDVTLTTLDPPLALSDPDKPGGAEACLAERLADVLASVEVPWLIAPSIHDHHPSHELVGRAVRDTIESLGRRSSVWWWRLWGQGGPGTTAVVLDDAEQALLAALSHHQGELARNQYGELLSARLTADAVLGAEQLFGFGAPAWRWKRVATYCETIFSGSRWTYATPRVIEPPAPFGPGEPGTGDPHTWLHSDSPSATQPRPTGAATQQIRGIRS